jgi:release factor H-coupled RctB family protein
MNGNSCWIHRKGATPTDGGLVVIPGSRGDFSYLVKPIGDQQANAYSVAHGAGRKWARKDAKGRLSHRYSVEDFAKTPLGSLVICENKDLVYEEAPQAYKNIDLVVQDLVDAELVKVVALLRPLITYKMRRRS